MKKACFPMYIDLTDKKILVAGGGAIAFRRIRTLLQFGAEIHVISPSVCREINALENDGKITIEYRKYKTGDADGMQIVLAVTDDREVNRKIWKDCKESGIIVNVADDKSLCDFYFPSVVIADDTVIGINCNGADHRKVKLMRERIEAVFGDGLEFSTQAVKRKEGQT